MLRPHSNNKQAQGQAGEDLACQHLQQKGLTLVERNYRCARGEIDLIMRDGKALVFVEVRRRRNADFGGAAASVDARKQAKLIATALHYLQQQPHLGKLAARFDVVAITGNTSVTIDWIKDAFQT